MNGAQISIVGTTGKDVELRYTTGGRAVANVSVAVSRRWKRQGSNEWEEQTTWFRLVIWGELGENAAASIPKGTRVMVQGRLEERSWETPEGDKRTMLELIVDEIGPSLRWATAQVEKTERSSGDGGYRDDGGGSSGGGGSYRDTLGGDPIYGDDEPFLRDAAITDL